MVKTDEPDTWKKIPVWPVLDVRLIPEQQLLVFADFTRLAAYGHDGLVWQSPPLCGDDLRILGVTRDTIEAIGYEPSDSRDLRLALDIRTGIPSFN
jgi:hypothetical protein